MRDLNGRQGNQTYYEQRYTRSQLEDRQLLFSYATLDSTSWNYVFQSNMIMALGGV